MTPLTVLYRWCASVSDREDSSSLNDLFNQVCDGGILTDPQIELLRKELFVGGGIDREAVNFLSKVVRRSQKVNTALEALFFEAIKVHLLQDGAIDVEKTNWLRNVLLPDGTVGAAEIRLLEELHTYARRVCPEFQQLFDDCVN